MCVGPGHFLTLLGAAVASIGALSAVFQIVLAAFLSTGMTRFSAEAANLGRELRAGAHEERRGPAKHRTISVQFNAARHHLHVVLVQAGARAIRALIGAMVTRFNAINIFFVCHINPFQT